MTILAMGALTILGLALRQRISGESQLPSIVTGVAGLLAAGAAIAVWRRWPHRIDMFDGFGWLAVPLLAVGLGAALPGSVGAPHLFIAALGAAVLTCALAVTTKRHVKAAAAAVTLCALGGTIAAARMWWTIPAQWLGMCTLVALLFVLTLGPTVALWVAQIRPPYFGSITGRDLFRRSAGLPVDAVTPVSDGATVASDDDADPDTTPRGAQIAAAAIRANDVLTGICVGAALALPAAVWATLMPGRHRGSAAAVLSVLFITIFISRGRAFADKRQAVALVCGAAAATCAGVVKYVTHEQVTSSGSLAWGALAVGAFGGAGLLAALLVPVTRFTPLVRMTAEWLEIAAIIVALPLAAWISGLFTWVRMR